MRWGEVRRKKEEERERYKVLTRDEYNCHYLYKLDKDGRGVL